LTNKPQIQLFVPDPIKYVIITPVKDEEAYIGETISSVISQTLRPIQWVIVNDGSSDRTEEIVQDAAIQHPWIRSANLPPRADRSFSAVVHATEAGVCALTVADYHYIGLLDSDIRFDKDYFKKVIKHFEASPGLGLGGGMVVDPGHRKDRLPRNLQDVPGAVQFFRRECFERLGGLIAIPEGGWDALTCVRARMLGYETRLFTDLVADHLKPRNIAEGGVLRRKWRMGIRDYALGYHFVFEVFKCIGRLRESPPIIGAAAWLSGYFGAVLSRRKRLIPDDLLRFNQAEQLERLKQAMGLNRRLQGKPGRSRSRDKRER
jgi:poly-beta-1,6-N-acetyl-D-glucosamine synthase